MDITGTLKVKNGEVAVNDKFRKREFVIEDNSSQYPQMIMFQLTQDRCSLIDGYKVGEKLKVHFNLRGREWKSPSGEVKYFNTLEAWRLEKFGAGQVNGGQDERSEFPTDSTGFTSAGGPADDLPF